MQREREGRWNPNRLSVGRRLFSRTTFTGPRTGAGQPSFKDYSRVAAMNLRGPG